MLKKNESGFTIVELLITIGICGIIIPVLAAALSSLAVLNNRSRDLALVNMLAQNKAELLRSSGFNSIPVGTVDFTTDLPSLLASPKSASYTVTNVDPSIKEVVISISYKDYGNTRNIQYKTLISEIGVGQ